MPCREPGLIYPTTKEPNLVLLPRDCLGQLGKKPGRFGLVKEIWVEAHIGIGHIEYRAFPTKCIVVHTSSIRPG